MLANGATAPPPTTAAVATTPSDNTPAAQQRPALRCPRCDSSNTKFCYYNNYSLSQPRHFCKSCRRYWTHGGALRNVPIGGASRKSKKPRRSSIPSPAGPAPVVVDFQLGGSSLISNPNFHPPPPPLTRLNYPTNLSSPFGDLNLNPPPPPSNFIGLNNYPLINTTNEGVGGSSSLLASSIESLSSLNQELHWKLQQQRMSLIFDDVAPVEAVAVTTNNSHIDKKPQPIFFQNLEATNSFAHHHHSSAGTHHDRSNNSPNNNQWFFDTSYGGGGGGGSSGSRNNNCGDGNENEDGENVASRLNSAGGYVLDKDGVIKFQQYAQWLGIKKI